MSGGSKQQYKQFSINNAEDACLVMAGLISGTIVNLDKYRMYIAELDTLIEKAEGEFVDADSYESIRDKLLYRQREILKLTADRQKSSFSYVDFRDWLVKHNYLKAHLSQSTSAILSELLDIRNWSFHNPQSLMVAAKEAAEKRLPNELKGIAQIKPQLNPVVVQKTNRYELVLLGSLSVHASNRLRQFEEVLSNMKKDYQELYDAIDNKPFLITSQGLSNKVQYREVYGIGRLLDYHSDVAQISMAIQKSKYDGSEEKYNEWVGRVDNDNSQE